MVSRAWWFGVASLVLACASERSLPGGEGDDGADPIARCVDLPRPAGLDAVRLVALPFPRRGEIEEATDFVHAGGYWYVTSKPGLVHRVDARGEAAPVLVLDIRDRVRTAAEAGLLGIAFSPAFASDGRVFLSYTTPGGSVFTSKLSSFVSRDGGATIDPESEAEIFAVEQPYTNHNGGDIAFGRDGHLYWGLGDGGSGGDPGGRAQDPDVVLGKVLRFDVSPASGYAIPPDNPFAAGGGRPEIFALGLRNPWRIGFDAETGELWVGDVGQNLWEEVDRVRLGGNYGWNVREGSGCFGRDACRDEGLEPPVAEYRNIGAASVVGGIVYRGSMLPDLVGRYVYSDYALGDLWSVREGEAPEVLLRGGARAISAWAADGGGELHALSYRDGTIHRVEPPAASDGPALPIDLSETGCVNLDDPLTPPEGALAYDVHVPFWSDGADKSRHLVLPRGARITGNADGDLELPSGSVLVKSFVRDERLLETRLLVRHADGNWSGYSYAWREDGGDAELVLDGRAGADWWFPATAECSFCHTREAGFSLGLEAAQLAGAVLERFAEAGVLVSVPTAEPLPDPYGNGPLESRARAYLHVNCSQCHRPDAPSGRARIDLRHTVAFVDTGACDALPRAGSADLADARIVAPGAPERSTLLARMRSTGSVHMPPVGSLRVDEGGSALIEAWIAAMTGCP